MNRSLLVLLVCSLAGNVYLLWFVWLEQEQPVATKAWEQAEQASFESALPKGVRPQISQPASVQAKPSALALSKSEVAALFAAGDYSLALGALATLVPQEASTLRYQWLAQCMQWVLEDGHDSRAEQFIAAGLARNPADLDFGQLRAEQLIQQGEVLAGIDLIYELMNYSDTLLQGEFAGRLQVLFQEEVKRLSEMQAWQPLVVLTERLLWHEPQHPPYLLVHARALYHLQRYEPARASLLPLLQDEYYSARANELLQQINLLARGDERIELKRIGAHHVVSATVNNRESLQLMIDTGASYTVIASAVFAKSLDDQASYVREILINTAGGQVNAALYRLSSFQIGSYSVSDMDVVVMPLDTQSNAQGLLGMNYLHRFRFEIDQQRDQLVLSPRQ